MKFFLEFNSTRNDSQTHFLYENNFMPKFFKMWFSKKFYFHISHLTNFLWRRLVFFYKYFPFIWVIIIYYLFLIVVFIVYPRLLWKIKKRNNLCLNTFWLPQNASNKENWIFRNIFSLRFHFKLPENRKSTQKKKLFWLYVRAVEAHWLYWG